MDNIIDQWFKEASQQCLIFTTPDEDFLIYKGFKIGRPHEIPITYIKDARLSNMYTDVSKTNTNLFKKHGFIKGVDIISHKRDSSRIKYYKRQTEQFYDKKRRAEKELKINKDVPLNTKRVRNLKIRIRESLDLMFFYKSRVKQFKNKY